MAKGRHHPYSRYEEIEPRKIMTRNQTVFLRKKELSNAIDHKAGNDRVLKNNFLTNGNRVIVTRSMFQCMNLTKGARESNDATNVTPALSTIMQPQKPMLPFVGTPSRAFSKLSIKTPTKVIQVSPNTSIFSFTRSGRRRLENQSQQNIFATPPSSIAPSSVLTNLQASDIEGQQNQFSTNQNQLQNSRAGVSPLAASRLNAVYEQARNTPLATRKASSTSVSPSTKERNGICEQAVRSLIAERILSRPSLSTASPVRNGDLEQAIQTANARRQQGRTRVSPRQSAVRTASRNKARRTRTKNNKGRNKGKSKAAYARYLHPKSKKNSSNQDASRSGNDSSAESENIFGGMTSNRSTRRRGMPSNRSPTRLGNVSSNPSSTRLEGVSSAPSSTRLGPLSYTRFASRLGGYASTRSATRLPGASSTHSSMRIGDSTSSNHIGNGPDNTTPGTSTMSPVPRGPNEEAHWLNLNAALLNSHIRTPAIRKNAIFRTIEKLFHWDEDDTE